MNPWKRRFLLETTIFTFYVKFWGCKCNHEWCASSQQRKPRQSRPWLHDMCWGWKDSTQIMGGGWNLMFKCRMYFWRVLIVHCLGWYHTPFLLQSRFSGKLPQMKGYYCCRDPFFTSMIMRRRVMTPPDTGMTMMMMMMMMMMMYLDPSSCRAMSWKSGFEVTTVE